VAADLVDLPAFGDLRAKADLGVIDAEPFA
jgi:hypothetical protein